MRTLLRRDFEALTLAETMRSRQLLVIIRVILPELWDIPELGMTMSFQAALCSCFRCDKTGVTAKAKGGRFRRGSFLTRMRRTHRSQLFRSTTYVTLLLCYSLRYQATIYCT